MLSRTRTIAAAATVAAALAVGSGVAVAATTGAKPGTPAKTMSVTEKHRGSAAIGASSAGERQAHDAMTAAVARELNVGVARAGAALRPLFAAGRAGPSSPAFVAAARSLGVSTQQLTTALIHAKQSVAASLHIKQGPGGSKAAGSKAAGSKAAGSKAAGATSAQGRQAHDAMTAAVARDLNVGVARAGAALRPLFAAGRAYPSSPAFVAAARSLGVSTQQLTSALMHAKQSLAPGN